ncbi:MAG: hypothetical protein GWO24_35510 [Akkermansiaceae bacterium]|nr:hypothetical protein [Akkermansiaceae bacterium]
MLLRNAIDWAALANLHRVAEAILVGGLAVLLLGVFAAGLLQSVVFRARSELAAVYADNLSAARFK